MTHNNSAAGQAENDERGRASEAACDNAAKMSPRDAIDYALRLIERGGGNLQSVVELLTYGPYGCVDLSDIHRAFEEGAYQEHVNG